MHAATHKYPLATLLGDVAIVVVFAPCGGRERFLGTIRVDR
jgi:hypothetical protein